MPKRSISIIIFVVVALIIVVAITFATSSGSTPATPTTSAGSETTNPNAQGTPTATTPAATGQTYTLADVSKHNNKADCWTTINGGVYNVTAWISKHPGGAQAIIGLCGIDGSDAFNGQHGGERRPATELASFKIGDLSK
jgi:cytochrome b involved in lipid metabolism